MLMFGLNEIIDWLAMANSVCWYCHVLRREDGHVLRSTLDFEVEGQTAPFPFQLRMAGKVKVWFVNVEKAFDRILA